MLVTELKLLKKDLSLQGTKNINRMIEKKIPIANSDFFINEKEAGNINFKEFRKKIQDWLKKQNETNPRFQKVYNQSFKHDIYFTWQGLKNDVSESSENYTEKLLSFEVLPEIVENAIYDKSGTHKNKDRTDVKSVHHFVSEVIVNKICYKVDIIIFEVIQPKKDNIFVYAHTLSLK